MFDRPQSGERAILVHLDFGPGHDSVALDELRELTLSAGATPLAEITGSRHSPDPKYFCGTGKADEIREAVVANDGELVIFNHELSPSQERNLERLLKCRVLDRTGLILDIFAQRAQSHDGKLQVELAQLRHLSTRLVRGWTHLERQKGGIGLRGPGESQLETDRRLIGQRIRALSERLEKVRGQREQGRRRRQKNDIPTVALVGYTNAGKSTLFNRLTHAHVYQADQLFATLDPTVRRLDMEEGGPVVLADTVGFIRDLPHDLVAAFRSTLREAEDADLLLHVMDASSEERAAQQATVEEVLEEIGAGELPQLLVYNKIDLIDEQPRIDRDAEGRPVRVWISALKQQGFDELLVAIRERTREELVEGWITLAPSQGRARAKLFELGAVREEAVTEQGGWDLHVEMPERDYRQLCSHESLGDPLH
ncbi:MAG: ribosome rescue GTPase HflX [Gammaproteobacteria bacterium]|nr:ribosome rescue GTPase HflX [Gammaproteobacteria bacterium]